ncbi:MAG: DUF4127 family protein, partial [Oscillospiraceae bacterium]
LALCAALWLVSQTATGTPVAEVRPIGDTIAYVPLDDRPVNTDRVVYLTESLGYAVSLPDPDLYKTRLDGQPRNENGTGSGNRAALLTWVRAQDAAGCDLFLLSLDQLLSGGLVNSRSLWESTALHFPDGTTRTEMQAIDDFLLTLGDDPNNQILLLDTVMRLAPTVGYDGFGLDGYETLRGYGREPRPVLDGAPTVDDIIANYPLGMDGETLPVPAGLTQTDLDHYLAARARKLRLIDAVLEKTADKPQFQFLIGVDDSAADASVQTAELAYLRQAVAGRGAVLSGADELGMMAVCKLYASTCDRLPTVTVRYFGGSEDSASSDYDHQPMTEIVAQHLSYLGLTGVERDGDLQLLVLTAPKDPGQAKRYCDGLIAALNENEANGTPTLLMDAAKNQYGDTFQKKLVRETNLGFLLGYGGFYDLANVTGVTLSNGVARWLYLMEADPSAVGQNRAFVRTLADSLIKDLCYKNRAKIDTARYVKNELSGDPDNFSKTGTDTEDVLAFLRPALEQDSRDVLDNLAGSNLLLSLSPYTEAGMCDIWMEDIDLPWQRVFEIRTSLHMGPFRKPLAYSAAIDPHFQ